MALEKEIVCCHHPPDFANFHFRRRWWHAKVIQQGSIAYESRAHQSTSERTNCRWTMYRWLFEVGGGHGPTKWTRRRTADTRPSGGDLVDVPNAARGSEKVTQEKNPSVSKWPLMIEASDFTMGATLGSLALHTMEMAADECNIWNLCIKLL